MKAEKSTALQAWELSRKGLSFAAIARQLNTDERYIPRLIAIGHTEAPPDRTTAVNNELETLALAETHLIAALTAQQHITQKGDIVPGQDTNTTIRAAEALARISAHRRKLLGLDQPTQTQTETHTTYTINGINPADLI